MQKRLRPIDQPPPGCGLSMGLWYTVSSAPTSPPRLWNQCSNCTEWGGGGVRLHLPRNLYGWGVWMWASQMMFVWKDGGQLKRWGVKPPVPPAIRALSGAISMRHHLQTFIGCMRVVKIRRDSRRHTQLIIFTNFTGWKAFEGTVCTLSSGPELLGWCRTLKKLT